MKRKIFIVTTFFLLSIAIHANSQNIDPILTLKHYIPLDQLQDDILNSRLNRYMYLDNKFFIYRTETLIMIYSINDFAELHKLSQINHSLQLFGAHISARIVDNKLFVLMDTSFSPKPSMLGKWTFVIYDMAEPEHPVFRGVVSIPGITKNFSKNGNQAFFATESFDSIVPEYSHGIDGLLVYNISNPEVINQIGSIEIPSPINIMTADDNFSLINTEKGIQIVDLSDLNKLSRIGIIGETIIDINNSGRQFFMSYGDQGLKISELTEANILVQIEHVEGNFGSIWISDNFMISNGENLKILDITNPDNARIIASYPIKLQDVFIKGNKIYGFKSTDENPGIYIFSLDPVNFTFSPNVYAGKVGFGDQALGVINFVNTSQDSIILLDAFSDNPAFGLSFEVFPAVVPSDSEMSILFGFTPAKPGIAKAIITINTNLVENPIINVNVSGMGTAGEMLSLNTHDFGTVLVGTEKTFDELFIMNNFDEPITLDSLSVSEPEFTHSITNFPYSIPPQSELKIEFGFKPVENDSVNGTIGFYFNSLAFQRFLTLKGTGIKNALSLNPENLDFGETKVGTTQEMELNIQNILLFDITIDSIVFDNPNFSLQEAIFPDSLKSLITGNFKLRFNPLQLGVINGTMQIFTNLSEYPTEEIILSGRGIAPVPDVYTLQQNYPNPFNASTLINFFLWQDSKTKIVIYSTSGREVRTLLNSDLSAGEYTFEWDGKNEIGKDVASGVYLFRMVAGGLVQSKKMLLIK